MTKLNVAQAEFVRGLAEQIREYVRPLHERVKALEAKATPEWKGVYQHGQAYVEANLVTHAGGLWIARCNTMEKPGHESWTLIVKRGSFDHDPPQQRRSQAAEASDDKRRGTCKSNAGI